MPAVSIQLMPDDCYYDTETDPQRPEDEHGYIATGSGDSGSPYWLEDNTGAETLIAINHGGIPNKNENKGWYGKDDYWQCRVIATKITQDIKIWLSEKEGKELTSA